MPAPTTTADFLALCRKSGVVDEAHLALLTGPATDSPAAVARALIRTGGLTKFQAAQLLAGKYKGLKFDRLKILDRIGSGGMGTVFLCEHTGLRKRVAVKVLPPDQAGDEGTRERFFREGRAAAALDHPNIVRVYDANTSNGLHYIVMEYVEGKDLQTHINKYGPLPYEKACTYVAQAALGLQHAADKGIVHRDIKPSNLLVDKDGVVKILDMGLARFRADTPKDNLTAKYDRGAILGTADYMAPEQVLESSRVDGRADIYSLGVTLYALINGKPPFSGNSTQKMAGHQMVKATPLTRIRQGVPKGLSAVVDKMMAKSPAERYQSPAAVIAALSPWLEADTVPLASSLTGKMFPASAIRRPASQGRGPAAVAAVAVAALVFGGVGVWALSGGKDSAPNPAAAQDPPPTSPPAVTGNPTPKAPPPVTPRPPAAGRNVFRLDFAGRPDAAVRAHGGTTDATGRLPGKFSVFTWEKDSTVEAAVATVAGERAITLRTTAGRPAAMIFGPYLKLEADTEYRIAVEYRLEGTIGAQLKIDEAMTRGRDVRALPPTGGAWAAADVAVRTGTTAAGKLEFSYSGSDVLAIRTVEVTDLGPAPGPAQVLYESDFAAAPPMRFRKRGQTTVEQSGGLPPGLKAYPWAGDALMECAIEPTGDRRALVLRNLEGRESAMLFLPDVRVKPGVTYWVSVEYRSTSDVAGTVRVACEPARARDVGGLVTTRGDWRTVHVPFQLVDGEREKARVEIHARGRGADKGLVLRSITVTEAGAAMVTTTAARPYRLDLTGTKAFARRYKGNTIVESQGDGGLPAGWAGRTETDATLGDVFADTVGGAMALGVRNHEGPPAVRLFTPNYVLQATVGKRYTVRVAYQTESNGAGWVEVRVGASVVRKVDLTPSVGVWKDADVTVTAPADGGVTLTVGCESVGSDSSVYIKGVEVREVP